MLGFQEEAIEMSDDHRTNPQNGRSASSKRLAFSSLVNADLRNADLIEANLFASRLTGADLRGANLQRAVLWDADLRGCRWEGTDFRGACYNSETRFPHDFCPETQGLAFSRSHTGC
jgi:uncharacterized protein YjbI with pentapeptide repeats